MICIYRYESKKKSLGSKQYWINTNIPPFPYKIYHFRATIENIIYIGIHFQLEKLKFIFSHSQSRILKCRKSVVRLDNGLVALSHPYSASWRSQRHHPLLIHRRMHPHMMTSHIVRVRHATSMGRDGTHARIVLLILVHVHVPHYVISHVFYTIWPSVVGWFLLVLTVGVLALGSAFGVLGWSTFGRRHSGWVSFPSDVFGVGKFVVLLPFHASVLEPDFYLSFGQD